MPQPLKKYKLLFPDGYTIEFVDFNESVDYTASKPFHRPLVFHGRIIDNIANWKIIVSSDKITHTIGLKFEKEIKMIPVEIIRDKVIDISDVLTFIFPFGSFFPSLALWKVEGTDIVKLKSPFDVKIAGKRPYQVEETIYDGIKLTIRLSRLYRYDVSDFYKDLKNRLNKDVELLLSLRRTGKKLSIFGAKHTQILLPYSYDKVILTIPETEDTLECKVRFTSDGRICQYQIKDKPLCKIIIRFDTNDNPDLNKIFNERKDVGVIYWISSHYEQHSNTKFNIRNAYNKKISCNKIEIEVKPKSKVTIQIRLDGCIPIDYTVENIKDTFIPKIITLKPELKQIRKIQNYLKRYKESIHIALICLSIGIMGGIIIAKWYFKKDMSSSQKVESLIENRLDTINDPKVSIKIIEDNQIMESKTTTPYQETLIKKLEGLNFTIADVKVAKQKLKGLNQEELISDAEACIRIINLNPKEKKELNIPGSKIYNLTVSNLTTHRKVMSDLISNDIFLSCTQDVFRSIAEVQKYINDNTNENHSIDKNQSIDDNDGYDRKLKQKTNESNYLEKTSNI